MSETSNATETQAAVPFDAGSAAQRLARVYAESMYAAAAPQNQQDEMLDQLRELVEQLLPSDPGLREMFDSLAVPRLEKAKLIDQMFGGKASGLFLNFLHLLNDHDRLGLLTSIYIEARADQDERAGRVRVYVRSAVELSDDQRERLRQRLTDWLKKTPVLVEAVDPDLLGGMRVLVGDELFDLSVRTQLQNIRTQLLSSSSYEIQSRRDRFSSD